MSEPRLSFSARFLVEKGRLSAEDVMTLRSESFPDGVRSSDDAALLLAIQYSCPEQSAEWDAFFIEALTDFVVRQTHPQGSLDDTNATWLIKVLSSDGVIHSSTEFEVLMHVLDVATDIPPMLVAFALDQLRHALSNGVGAYRQARSVDRDGITLHDLDFIRYVLRGSLAASGTVLSPVEVAALVRIDQATIARVNHPGWASLRQAFRLQRPENPREPAEIPRSGWLRLPDAPPAEIDTAA